MGYDPQWGKKLRFTEADLICNQQGELSPSQNLKNSLNTVIGGILGVGIGMIAGLFGMVSLTLGEPLLGILSLIMGVGLLAFTAYIIYAYIQVARKHEIKMTEGAIEIAPMNATKGTHGVLITPVGKIWLKGSPIVREEWYVGKTFRVYYLNAGVMTFLSLEEISDNQNR
ncbi:MAG TPA: hypothetical protein PLZ51_04255 [Aggregatilineales bacterium]|nr:hypothetical protein [Aggregatilineales bacterium]